MASMDANAAQEISNELGTTPYLLDPVRAVPMRRPRYAWVTEPLEGALEDISIHSRSYWREVIAEAEYPDIRRIFGMAPTMARSSQLVSRVYHDKGRHPGQRG